MRVGIIATNGGPHSAEKWAAATAGQIIQIASNAAGDQELEGRRLELKILDILEQHHRTVQEKERDKLTNTAHDFDDININEHVDIDAIVNEIVDAGKQSKWATHFENPEVVNHIRNVIGTDLSTSVQIERFWHADRNPNDEKARVYKDKYHKGGYVS